MLARKDCSYPTPLTVWTLPSTAVCWQTAFLVSFIRFAGCFLELVNRKQQKNGRITLDFLCFIKYTFGAWKGVQSTFSAVFTICFEDISYIWSFKHHRNPFPCFAGAKTSIAQAWNLVIGHGNSGTGVTLLIGIATKPGRWWRRPGLVPRLGQQGPGAADRQRQAFAAPAPALPGTSEKSGGQVGQEANFKVSRSSFCRKSWHPFTGQGAPAASDLPLATSCWGLGS